MDNRKITETRLLKQRKRAQRLRLCIIILYTLCIVMFTATISTMTTFVCINALGYSLIPSDTLIPEMIDCKDPIFDTTYSSIDIDKIDNYVDNINIVNETQSTISPIVVTYNQSPDETFPIESEPVIEEAILEEEPEVIVKTSEPKVYINPDAIPDGPPMDKYYGWSEKDYQLLLQIIVGECQYCSKEEQMETGSVVLNRLYNSKYFGYANTISEVVYAPGQYACFGAGTAYKTPTELNKTVVLELLKNGSISPINVVFQSLFKQGDGVYKYFPDTGTYICYKD